MVQAFAWHVHEVHRYMKRIRHLSSFLREPGNKAASVIFMFKCCTVLANNRYVLREHHAWSKQQLSNAPMVFGSFLNAHECREA